MSISPGTQRQSTAREPRPPARQAARPGPGRPLAASWDPTRSVAQRVGRPVEAPQGGLAEFYGWRIYAIPVLAVITLVFLVQAVLGGDRDAGPAGAAPTVLSGADDPGLGPLTTDASGPSVVGAPPGDGSFDPTVPTGQLPAGGGYTEAGDGTYRVIAGDTQRVGDPAAQLFTYSIEVENGINTAQYGGDGAFAGMVDGVLADPRSWTRDLRFAFQRVDPAVEEPTIRITLTTPMTVRESCGYDIPLETSCYNRGLGRVVMNESRWARGAIAFHGDLGSYRQYLVNHEVGHAIGYQQHQPCESQGGLAPIMMQQSFGTANNDIVALDPAGEVPANGLTCTYNPWPYPRG